jgi:sugar phosphate permease
LNPPESQHPAPAGRRRFYGWYIAAAGAGTNCVVLGITQFGFGVFIEAFRVTFGWSVTAIALGYSIRTLEQGLFAPFTGYVADRVGPRRMAVAGIVIISLSLLLFSQATTLSVYYAASIVMALGQSIGGANAFTLAIMRWFVRRRGNAMSIITTGNGFGYFATLALAALLAALGLRDAFLVLAAIVFCIGLPLALVIRDRPEELGLLPDGDAPAPERAANSETKAKVRSASGSGVREALRTPSFYILVLAMAAGAAAQLVWIVFQVPHLVAQGFSITFVGTQAAIYGMIAIPLRWGVGWLGDRFGRARTYMYAVCLEGVGLCFLAFVTPERWWLFIPFYLTFGLGHCGWLVLNQTLAADFFGARNFATIRGLVHSFSIPVSILLPLCMGYVYDTQGNYQWAYVGVAALVFAGALSLCLVRGSGTAGNAETGKQ